MKNVKLYILLILIGCSCKKSNSVTTNISHAKKDSVKINSYEKKINNFEYTSLGLYCKEGNLIGVRKLVEKGANINLAKTDGIYEYDALYVAIENQAISVIEYLLKNQANANQIYTDDGLTPLSLAIKLNFYAISKILIKQGADPNGADIAGSDYKITPLLLALSINNIKLAELLLESGADPYIKDQDNNTAIDQSLKKGNDWAVLFAKYSGNRIGSKISEKWKGIYYYKPYDNIDSLGNYYAKIQSSNSEFGFSGNKSFNYKIKLKIAQDTLLLYNEEDMSLLGKIFRENNQFWILSDFINNSKSSKDKSKYYPLKFATSSDDIE